MEMMGKQERRACYGWNLIRSLPLQHQPPPAVAAVCLKHRSIRFPSAIHRPVGQILPIYLQIFLPEGFLETTKV